MESFMTEKELMLSEKLYLANDEELTTGRTRSRQLTRLFNNTTEEQNEYRVQLLKKLFKKTGDNIYIEPPFRCDYGSNITVGENFYANFDCIILDVNEVIIGDNVLFAPRVCVYTAGHPVDADIRNSGVEFGKKVIIGNNVWIGGSTVINPGVTIGANTVIGSGSVVTKDIPEGVVAVGNPCRVIRKITDEDRQFWDKQVEERKRLLNKDIKISDTKI
ncbi:MAG: sugar O-acetyltransferase [Lachnospiraceae bacterium]|nr:sugar O-acetyltransferase [Lachnospiraceae bacterium]